MSNLIKKYRRIWYETLRRVSSDWIKQNTLFFSVITKIRIYKLNPRESYKSTTTYTNKTYILQSMHVIHSM